jgi:hypothetical protein
MIDLYLRATDEDTMLTALQEAELASEASAHHALDLIGVLYNDDGEELPGFHSNLRLLERIELPEALAVLIIDPPNTPHRVWAS